ncbi:MAG: hypothetical protein H0X26_04150 [Alphaproteobacteria bacterium]|nr:hypothetical protein [Alphaproteobacteria bacterium]
MSKLKTILVFILFFVFLTNVFAMESEEKPALSECMTCTPFKKERFGVIETPHVKVVLHFNQYYLGREVIAVKIDEKDTDKGLTHYPDMEYVDENCPLISQEVRDVLYATNNGRRDWLKAAGYNVPELFNVLIGNNLAFGKEQQPGKEPNPHAHLHSFMRYKAPITIAYQENGEDAVDIQLLDPKQDLPKGFKALRFVDTEFGRIFVDTSVGFLLDKQSSQQEYDQLPEAEKEGLVITNPRNRKLPPAIMMWAADEIAKYSAPYIKEKGYNFVTRKNAASKK